METVLKLTEEGQKETLQSVKNLNIEVDSDGSFYDPMYVIKSEYFTIQFCLEVINRQSVIDDVIVADKNNKIFDLEQSHRDILQDRILEQITILN